MHPFDMAEKRCIAMKLLTAMFAYRRLYDAVHIFQMSVQIEYQLQIGTIGALDAFVSVDFVGD